MRFSTENKSPARAGRTPFVLGLAAILAFALGGCLTDDKGQEGDGPTISVSPSDQVVSEGALATFTVTASGSGDLDYQWIKDGVDMEGRTSPTLSFIANDSDDNAEIRVRVKDESGTTLSSIAYLRIRVESEDVTLGAQGSLLPSSLDLDSWTSYTAGTAANNSNFIDLVFAYSTATGNDSLALYSPQVAKNGTGAGSSGFDFMQSWPSANSIEIRKVEVDNWSNVMTAADIKNLFDNGSAGSTPGRIFVRAGTTVVAKSNLGLYVLLRVTSVTAQSASGAGTIDAKAKW